VDERNAFDVERFNINMILPMANAGADQSVHPGNTVTLDGNLSSDPDSNYPLTYKWSISSKPEGSSAALTNPDTVNPFFTADMLGDYIITLWVIDSTGRSSNTQDTVTVSCSNGEPGEEEIPEFPTVALPIVAVIGLMFLFQRRKCK
jgi:hypothetical protein